MTEPVGTHTPPCTEKEDQLNQAWCQSIRPTPPPPDRLLQQLKQAQRRRWWQHRLVAVFAASLLGFAVLYPLNAEHDKAQEQMMRLQRAQQEYRHALEELEVTAQQHLALLPTTLQETYQRHLLLLNATEHQIQQDLKQYPHAMVFHQSLMRVYDHKASLLRQVLSTPLTGS